MRDPYQVLHEKLLELLKLKKETAALRLAVSLIEEEQPVSMGETAAESTPEASSLQFPGN